MEGNVVSHLYCDKCKMGIFNTNLALVQWYQEKKVLPQRRKLKGFQIVHCKCSYNEIQIFEDKKRIWDGTIEYFLTERGLKKLQHFVEDQLCENDQEVKNLIARLKRFDL